MILVCENCDHGYKPAHNKCPWCGASATLAHMREPATVMLDTECYPNYWLAKFKSTSGVPELFGSSWQGDFELFEGHPLDTVGLMRRLSLSRVISFNGNAYDVPMVMLAINGATNEQLKQANDEIIKGGLRPWQFYERWGVESFTWLDHIDLFEVAPGQASLKMYGGKMHSRRLRDLPYHPDTRLGLFERIETREYCGNDLETTNDLYKSMSAQIALREQMSDEYRVDLRSKSDAQIAEAVIKSFLPFKPEPPFIEPGTTFYYRPPAWLRFVNLPLLELLARSPFTVNGAGYVDMTDELANTVVRIGNSAYRMGMGGLHSSEERIFHRADAATSLQDVDVTSYYPSLILNTGIYPQQIGPEFQTIFRSLVETRIQAKRAGDKKKANSLKTVTNGTFGKLANRYSILYAPSEMIQVTITGQLALLMLIEQLELCSIPVVSANTDGILVKCPAYMNTLRDHIVAGWRAATGFETESVDYVLMASRDVNSYIAVGTDGKPKLKGAYAPPEPGPSGWPNPTGTVCVDALVAYLQHGTPLAETIMTCRDVRRFVHIRQVRGGGEWVEGEPMNKSASQKEMRAVCERNGWRESQPKMMVSTVTGEILPLADAYRSLFNHDSEYLGRAVRWYYAREGAGHIRYVESKNKVATTEGCRPLMELPDDLPGDVDHQRYINDAQAMLADIGVLA